MQDYMSTLVKKLDTYRGLTWETKCEDSGEFWTFSVSDSTAISPLYNTTN